jgi:hypothetical protein
VLSLRYSNHDSTLRVILSAFKVFDAVWPPYASHIALELWEDETGKIEIVQKANQVSSPPSSFSNRQTLCCVAV